MPESLRPAEFVKEAWEDFKSPTTSNFLAKLAGCRSTVAALEEIVDVDRSRMSKLKKSVKALYSSGNLHVTNDAYVAENLKQLAVSCQRDTQTDVAAAFIKFSVVAKELSALMKNLMQNLNNIVMFPLDSFLKGDLRGVKGDLKKPFDKASKDYDAKFAKVEKEKRQLAKDAGMIKTELTGAEVAEEMEKERRVFQLQMCEYLIKVNDIRTKKGVDLLHHLVEYYQAQYNYFQDGLKTIEHYRCYVDELVVQLSELKQRQDAERRELIELRDVLRTSTASLARESGGPGSSGVGAPLLSTGAAGAPSAYSLHQLHGDKAHGYERSGFLLKKSEGKVRKVWQRRRCSITDGIMRISHSDTTKEPVRLNLLTCQVKLLADDVTKKCFDLVSSSENRTYHFQADDTQDMEAWISVLNNAKESVLLRAFGELSASSAGPFNQSVRELTRTIIGEIRRRPGNNVCCDCSAPDPEWLSVNLGVLICLECCGIHRELGVHISRTQSLVIDDLGTAQLLLARAVSNQSFNDVMEATLRDVDSKPSPQSSMDVKKAFIRSKYERHRFAIVTCTNVEDRRQDLKQAILGTDILALLQVYAEGIDFSEPLPDTEQEENALHLAIVHEDGASLFIVDFIIQNTNRRELSQRTSQGHTALHLCALHDRAECMKLLLRMHSDLLAYEDLAGQTALDIARQLDHQLCIELLNHAASGKTEMFENVNIDWNLWGEDHQMGDFDFSDDDLEGCTTPDYKTRSRPASLVLSSDSTLGVFNQRTTTVDGLKALPLPPPPAHKQKLPSVSSTGPGSVSSLAGIVGPPTPLTALRKKAPPPPSTNQLSTSLGIPTSHHPTNLGSANQLSTSLGSSNQMSSSLGPTNQLASPLGAIPYGRRPVRGRSGHSRNPSDPGFDYLGRLTVAPLDTPPPLPAKKKPSPSAQAAVLGQQPGVGVGGGPMGKKAGGVGQASNEGEEGAAAAVKLSRTSLSPAPRRTVRRGHNEESEGHRDPSGSSRRGESLSTSQPPEAPLAGVAQLGTQAGSKQAAVLPAQRRCVALYNCQADNDDELSFREGDVIVILKSEDDDWWEGALEAHPECRGVFPSTFVALRSNSAS